MARNVSLTLKADAAPAVQEFLKLTDAEQKATNELKKMGVESAKAGREGRGHVQTFGESVKGLMGPLRQVAGALGFSFGVGAVLEHINERMRIWHGYLDRIGGLQRTAGQAMAGFAAMQPSGQREAAVRAAADMGARGGMMPEASLQAAAGLQRRLGSRELALRALGQVSRLSQTTGLTTEGAQQAVLAGTELGMTPERAGSFALAATTAGLTPEMIDQVSTQMRTRGGVMGRLWHHVGIQRPGEDPLAQIEALRRHRQPLTTIEAMTRHGLRGGQGEALSRLAEGWPRVAPLAADLRAMERSQAGVEGEVPAIGLANRMARTDARRRISEVMGVNAPAAAERMTRRGQAGRLLEEMGEGHRLNERGESDSAWVDMSLRARAPGYVFGPRDRISRRLREIEAEEGTGEVRSAEPARLPARAPRSSAVPAPASGEAGSAADVLMTAGEAILRAAGILRGDRVRHARNAQEP